MSSGRKIYIKYIISKVHFKLIEFNEFKLILVTEIYANNLTQDVHAHSTFAGVYSFPPNFPPNLSGACPRIQLISPRCLLF